MLYCCAFIIKIFCNILFYCLSLVLKLGSGATFSSGLLALQQEVGPLYSIPNCPRDFIRTSVERVFRDRGFLVDWCKFLLVSIL